MLMKEEHWKTAICIFSVTLIILVSIFAVSKIKTGNYNKELHHAVFSGEDLFSSDAIQKEGVYVKASARSSTWTKVFDLNNEGLVEPDYQAYTYDFSVTNDTKDEVKEFSFKLSFSSEVYIMSAWNGALEIHQQVTGGELVSMVPDMRVYDPSKHALDTVVVDGDPLIRMRVGDYLVYYPSSSMNAMEMPIKPLEGTTPGIILYVAIGDNIDGSTLSMDYRFHRVLKSEPLFWVSLAGFVIWLMALVNYGITTEQIRKYKKRHERDNEIIKESIETFTGFIDAKDPYTNGHSKRVAYYTRRLAKEMGFEGEALDRIYYTALLHDCGKIGVPDNILGKPGKLTEEEFEIIKSHTVRGGEILHRFKSLEHVEDGARYHHERYDGKGYPEGKAGNDIPLIARIICVADSYDAMNTDRVYRKKLSREQIINEITKNKGLQFDPQIADIMLDLLQNDTLGSEED